MSVSISRERVEALQRKPCTAHIFLLQQDISSLHPIYAGVALANKQKITHYQEEIKAKLAKKAGLKSEEK